MEKEIKNIRFLTEDEKVDFEFSIAINREIFINILNNNPKYEAFLNEMQKNAKKNMKGIKSESEDMIEQEIIDKMGVRDMVENQILADKNAPLFEEICKNSLQMLLDYAQKGQTATSVIEYAKKENILEEVVSVVQNVILSAFILGKKGKEKKRVKLAIK